MQRRAGELTPTDVPDPYRAANLRRRQQIVRAEGQCLDVVQISAGHRTAGGAQERAEAAPRSRLPDSDGSASTRDRERAPSGAYSIARAALPSKASKPPVLRSVSASIRSTRPSNLPTASVRPSGLIANGGGEASPLSWTNPVRNGRPSPRSPATSQMITLES